MGTLCARLALAAVVVLVLPARAEPPAPAKKLIVVTNIIQSKALRTPDQLLFLAQRAQAVLRTALRDQFKVLSYADQQLVELATSNGVDLAECSDQTCVAIGRKVSADFVVSGALTDLGNKVSLTLVVQDVRTAEVLNQRSLTFPREANLEEIALLVDQATAQLAAALKAPDVAEQETTGLLALYVDPPNAVVALDDGRAEAIIDGKLTRILSLGPHSVLVRAQGFQEQRSEVFIERGKPMTLRLTLLKPQPKATQAGTTYLTVLSVPSGARIFLDGKDTLKLTPVTLKDETIGEHEVVLQKEFYLPSRAPVTLYAERLGSVNVTLRANFGPLTVRSQPPGATITLEGEVKADRTPYTLPRLAARAYRLRVSLPRYRPVDQDVVVEPEVGATVEVRLVPRFGDLKITSDPPGATVFLDGDQREGSTPLTLEGVDEGPHHLRVTKTLYGETARTITVEAAKPQDVSLVLEPRFGALRVTADSQGATFQGAEVLIDGQKAGVTPFEDGRAKEGWCVIEVRDELHRGFEQRVLVRPRSQALVEAHLVPEFGVLVASASSPARLLVDGKDLGAANGNALNLRMGRHDLALEPLDPSRYRPYRGEVIVEVGKKKTVALTLEPRQGGAVVLSIPPGAAVLLGEERLGTTPLKVTGWFAGDYELRLEKESYVPSRARLSIKEGATAELEVPLLEVDMLKLNAELRATKHVRAGVSATGGALLMAGAGVTYFLARGSASKAQDAWALYLNDTSPQQIALHKDAVAAANSTARVERASAIALGVAAGALLTWALYEVWSAPSVPPGVEP